MSNQEESTLFKMVCPELSQLQKQAPMAKNSGKSKATSSFNFVGGIMVALFVFWGLWSFANPSTRSNPAFASTAAETESVAGSNERPILEGCLSGVDMRFDPPDPTFYDDPNLSYTIGRPIKNWDQKRREWLKQHPSFAAGASERLLMVTGSQAKPCKNPIGDHLLLRLFKNKVDYSRIHGYDLFYNNVLLQPKMFSYWAKIPVVRAAMVAHPEAEWIWWVDSDAAITDMDFKLPLHRYKDHNLVVHGWWEPIYKKKSWTGLNAGVFLIRNCQWSLDFMELWASMGPQTPNYDKWGETLRSTFKDKLFPESDDQSGLVYLLLTQKDTWGKEIYLEDEFYFEGYWLEIIETLDNITERYTGIETGVRSLRRRHAEKVSEFYGARWEAYLKDAGNGRGSWRRPFITHFTGCQPCSGKHNQMYSGQTCWDAMQKALNFADNQVLRNYGFFRPDLLDFSTVSPTPFQFPVET